MTQLKPPLIADGLTRTYSGKSVVIDASLTLKPGEITALVGHSGSGKTTLLRLLAGMEKPDAGTVKSGDKVLSARGRLVPPEQRRIGLIFQDFALFPHLDVENNISFGLHHLERQERVAITETWLATLDLVDRKSAYPHQLSGGEQQRVAIARALAPNPVAILMDEPFSGLDAGLREQARDAAIAAIRQAQTPALLVTHDPSEALGYADQIAIMSAGRILQIGTPENVYTKPTSLAAAKALGPLDEVQSDSLPQAWRDQLPTSGTLYFRPEAIRIDAESPVSLNVISARRTGALTSVTFALGGDEVSACILTDNPPQQGDFLSVSLAPESVFAFPSPQS